MKIKYVCDGTPERIPQIGQLIDLDAGLLDPKYQGVKLKFKVEKYGDGQDINSLAQYGRTYHGKPKAYELELIGALVIPAGSPIDILDDILGGGR